MRWIKQYLSLLVPLIALLISIESILLINRVLRNYEDLIGRNYAIVIVSEREINLNDLKSSVPEAFELLELDSKTVLEGITKQFSTQTMNNLKNSLPFFYSLKLNAFPSQARISQIEQSLKEMSDISRVEAFSKSHSQTYRLLVLLKGCILVFSSLVFILSLLLMVKQIEVWRFTHSERMEIMTYFGAPARLKNAPLYRLALIDSTLSALIVACAVIFILRHPKIEFLATTLGIRAFDAWQIAQDSAILLFSAYIISFLSVFVVILFQKEP